MTSAARYAIGDLARLAGVSRRTVRYYVQEGLISPPLGVGRGNHYGAEHLEQILHVKVMQEAGKTLEEIRRLPPGADAAPARAVSEAEQGAVQRTIWRRLTLAPGVELQIRGDIRLPSPSRLEELAAWCRRHLITNIDPEEATGDA
jgi:DNA-binding transcriptional MerR regulator